MDLCGYCQTVITGQGDKQLQQQSGLQAYLLAGQFPTELDLFTPKSD